MAQNTIIVSTIDGGPIQKEWIMDAVVMPGQLVEYASSTRIQMLSATVAPIMRVVVENGEDDTSVSGTYESGAQVPFVTPVRGDIVMVYASASAASTISATDVVYGNGAGFVHGGTALAGTQGLGTALATTVLTANQRVQIQVEVL